MMRRFLKMLGRWPTQRALNVACVIGLLALLIMVIGVVLGTPLPVVASMSVAQGLGGLACVLFGLSIAADVARTRADSMDQHRGP
jgi:putative Mn2+ efflux pump MntP